MKEFIIKCIVVTVCIYFVFNTCIPRYESIDKDYRFDRITGKQEVKTWLGWQ